MKIIRVLNTNTVLTHNENKEEIILLGAGLGFRKRPGDSVDESRIEKQFVLENKQEQLRFQEMVNSIPSDYIVAAEQIISLSRALFNMQLRESIHISLAEHIFTAIYNLKENVIIPNTLLLDIKQYYPNEYQVGVKGLDIIKERLGYALPEDEAGFIAMHFVNAQYEENLNIKKIIVLVKEMNELILKQLGMVFDETSLNYYRYMTHLKFFASRIVEKRHYKNGEIGILDALLSKYPREYECSRKVAEFVKEKYQYLVNNDEILYLTIHLTHLTHL